MNRKKFKFFSQLASVNWTCWISTQLVKYLRKNFDPIIWSSNLRTTTEASNTPYGSGAVIPQYTSNQFMNVLFHKTQILVPVFQSEGQFSLTSMPSTHNPVAVPSASYWLSSGAKFTQICRTSQDNNHCSCIDSCMRGLLQYSDCILGYCSVLYSAELCMLRGRNFRPLGQTDIYNMGSNGKLTLVLRVLPCEQLPRN